MLGGRFAAAAAMLAGLTSCALLPAVSATRTSATPSPTSAPAAPSPTAEVDPGQALAEGVAALTSAPEVRFEYEANLGTRTLVSVSGHTHGDSWEAVTRLSEPGRDNPYVMLARSVGQDSWMRMPAWRDSAGCWLTMHAQVPLGVRGLTAGRPAYLTLLDRLVAEQATPDGTTIWARLDLRTALVLQQPGALRFLHLTGKQMRTHAVPVTVLSRDGRVSRLDLSGADVVAAVVDAGGTVTPKWRRSVRTMKYQLSFPDAGRHGRVVAPDPSLQGELDGDGISCGGTAA
jgi:hypothetical protein